MNASHRLLANENRILDVWLSRVREEIRAAEHERAPIIIDTLPAYLRHVAEALSPDHPRANASEGTTAPQEHGGERARITRYSPEDIIREYQLLRDVILEVLSEGPLDQAEIGVITRSIDLAIREACTAYFLIADGIREQFTARLTHDLRNPLTAARSAAALILRRGDNPDTLKWAARIVENVDRADSMIRDLLDASRLRAGERLRFDLTECDLVSVIRDAVSHLEMIHGDRFVFVPGAPIRAICSAEGLRRALENLGSNAVKYGSEDTPITLSADLKHERVLIRVHNHGSYIPVEEQETLFEAFRRTRSARASGKQGWGLGLALVRGVAEAHGGSIEVDSLPERGTTFTLDIPADARPFQDAPITP